VLTKHTPPVTVKAIVDGPPVVPVWPTGGRAVGRGRRSTYEAAATGELAPGVPVLRVGQRLKVRRADLLRYLGVDAAA